MQSKPLSRVWIIWSLIAVVFVADFAMIVKWNMQIDHAPMRLFFEGAVGCLAVAGIGKYVLKDHSVEAFGIGLLQMNLASLALGWFTYLTTCFNLPLHDETFIAWDRALGLDWRDWLHWMNGHPQLADILSLCYWTFAMQSIGVAVALYALKHVRRAQCFIIAFILSCATTAILAATFPAVGAYVHYNLEPKDYAHIAPFATRIHEATLLGLRDHSMTLLPFMQNVKGIVTFPSFHAAMAVLLIYASRPLRYCNLLLLVLNIGMIAASPIDGGHYFVDIIAGVIIALAAIFIVHRLFEKTP